MVRVRVVVVGALVVGAISPLGRWAGLLSPHEGDDLGGGAPVTQTLLVGDIDANGAATLIKMMRSYLL